MKDDTYSISLNGMSSLMLKETDGYYHTVDESFLRIQYHDGDNPKWWEAWDKTGNHYEFRTDANYPSCSPGAGPYRWGLTKLTNIYNQSLEFTYQTDYAQFTMCSITVGIDRAIYPQSIVYPNKHYRIWFATAGGPGDESHRRTDRDTFSEGQFYFVEYQRLRTILIQYDPDADGLFDSSTVTIRQFTLSYSDDAGFNPSQGIYPNLNHDSGGKTLTLMQVQEQAFNPYDGSLNVTVKPVTFSYGDGMHLTRADNNNGGKVEFQYSPWSPDEGVWNDPYQAPGYWWRPSTTASTDFHGVWRSYPGNSKQVAPGKNHEFRFRLDNINGGREVVYGLDNGNGQILYGRESGTWANPPHVFDSSIATGSALRMPATAGLYPSFFIECMECNLPDLQYRILPTYYRVTQKTLTDLVSGASQSYTYSYNNPAMDTNCKDASLNRELCYYPTYTVFFGHSDVTETSPEGRQTKTTFFTQTSDYYLRGRSSEVQVKDPSGALYSDVTEAYIVVPTTQIDYSAFPKKNWGAGCGSYCYQDYQDKGVTNIYWIYLEKETSTIYAPAGSSNRLYKQTTYTYDQADQNGYQFGNLTRVKESTSSNGTTWVDYRLTLSGFYPNTGAPYLVGLPAYTNRYSCPAGNCNLANETVLSSTIYYYDNNQGQSPPSYTTAPTVGKLTGVKAMLHWNWLPPYYTTPYYHDSLYEYDTYGNRVAATEYPQESTLTNFGLTSQGYPAQRSEACYGGGSPAGCANDGYWTYLLSVKDAAGHQTTASYLDSGHDYKAIGQIVSETDPNGATTRYRFDALGRLLKLAKPGDGLTSPTRQVTFQDYSASPLKPFNITLVQKAGATVQKFYNGLGELIQEKTIGASLADPNCSGTCDILVDTQVSFANYQRVSRQTAPYPMTTSSNYGTNSALQKWTSAYYDPAGQKVQVSYPDGRVEYTAYSITDISLQGVTTRVLDAQSTDPRTAITHAYTDVWGRTVRVTPPTGPGVDYAYDALDRLTQTVRGGATTTLTYDNAGRKLQMIDPDMGSWIYTYDAMGNLKTQTDARSCVTTLVYDILNRLTGKTYSGGACASTPAVTYTYDSGTNGVGRRTGMNDASGSTSWSYDARARMISESKTITGSGTFITQWEYNSADQVSWMKYPGGNTGQVGEQVTYAYRPQMAPNTLFSDTYSYYYAQNTAYDAAGRVVSRSLGGAYLAPIPVVSNSYTYYPWTQPGEGGRLSNKRADKLSTPAYSLQILDYSYDAAGNITTIMDYESGELQTFTYDDLSRLTYWDAMIMPFYPIDWEEDTYHADSGNLASKKGVTLNYSDAAHPHAVTSTSDNRQFTYDANGNMIGRTISGTSYTLTYDAENRLTGVSGGATATFVYDGDGNRVRSTVNGITIVTIGSYFEWSGSTSSMLSYYDVGGVRVAMRAGTGPGDTGMSWLIGDHLGSTSVIANGSGISTGGIAYKPWGETASTWGTIPTRRLFTGQILEASLGLYFFNARWYDGYLNRWLSPDSIIPNPYDPQSFDRYAYVRNNPVNRVDPSGHFDNCSALTDRQCAIDNGWTIVNFKNEIASRYGIKLVEVESEEMKWSFENVKTSYLSLGMIDDKLHGNLGKMVSGSTFTIKGGGNQYYGYKTSSTNIDFHVASSYTDLPEINFLHETGHLLDNNDVFSNPLKGSTPTWVDKEGYVNSNLLLSKYKEAVQAKPMNEPYHSDEYWADAFANYVGGNINLSITVGREMYWDVYKALVPYMNH